MVFVSHLDLRAPERQRTKFKPIRRLARTMPNRLCPVCGANVEAGDLEGHVAKAHPSVRVADTLPGSEREELPPALRPSARPARVPKWVYYLIAAVAIVAVGFAAAESLLPHAPTAPAAPAIVTTCSSATTIVRADYSPLLVINDNGIHQHLPYDPSQSGDIGYLHDPAFTNPAYYCPSGQIHMLHTHDGSGILHAEIPKEVSGTPTLGDFFMIWGQPLSSGQVWNYSGAVTATMYDMDTGGVANYSSDPGSVPLYVPAAGPFNDSYAIPQNLIFGGTFGSGEFGGTFSGEIIWLNITG